MTKTLVGIPFYEKEGQRTLNVAVRNIDDRLNELDVDASIVVCVNGEDTSRGETVDLSLDRSRYNSEVEFITSEEPGQVKAMAALGQFAADRKIDRYFLTDADVFRLPQSLSHMWNEAEDNLVVGARYRPYPLKAVERVFGSLSREEKLLYHIFDGDQTPEARQALANLGMERKPWVKASLMLVDTDTSLIMHGHQVNATDSIMNRVIDPDKVAIADEAYFMHMGRIDMTDHIKARVRHFRAAKARGELETFLSKEVTLPSDEIIDIVADEIRQTADGGDYYAMLYICRCAVREIVNTICMQVVTDQLDTTAFSPEKVSLREVQTMEDARRAIPQFLAGVDWDDVQGFAVAAPPVTQERLRAPFLLDVLMQDARLSRRVYRSLGNLATSICN